MGAFLLPGVLVLMGLCMIWVPDDRPRRGRMVPTSIWDITSLLGGKHKDGYARIAGLLLVMAGVALAVLIFWDTYIRYR